MSSTARRARSVHVPSSQRDGVPVVDVCAGFSPHLIAKAIAKLWSVVGGRLDRIIDDAGGATVCPITLDTLMDPVMISDGGIYEMISIAQWLQNHACAPCTNVPLRHKQLLKLESLRAVIDGVLHGEGTDSDRNFLEKAMQKAETTQTSSQDCHENLRALQAAITATTLKIIGLQEAVSRAEQAAHELQNRIATWAEACIKASIRVFSAQLRLALLRRDAKREATAAVQIQRRWRELRRRRALREKRRQKRISKRAKALAAKAKKSKVSVKICMQKAKKRWLDVDTSCEICVAVNSTVRELKLEIEKATNVPAGQQQLTCSGEMLNDADVPLSTLVCDESIVVLLTVRAWTDEEIALAKEELRRNTWNERKTRNILGTMGDDKRVVMCAVQCNGCNLAHVSEEMKSDRYIVLAAVQKAGWALQYASEEMKGDRKIVMAAVRQNGSALQHAAQEMREDREVVLVAVGKGWPLELVPEEMKGDREVVIAAVQQDPYALKYAAEDMKNNEEIVIAACRKKIADGNLTALTVLDHASAGMKQNERVRRMAGL